jgi:hypothetical protein
MFDKDLGSGSGFWSGLGNFLINVLVGGAVMAAGVILAEVIAPLVDEFFLEEKN